MAHKKKASSLLVTNTVDVVTKEVNLSKKSANLVTKEVNLVTSEPTIGNHVESSMLNDYAKRIGKEMICNAKGRIHSKIGCKICFRKSSRRITSGLFH